MMNRTQTIAEKREHFMKKKYYVNSWNNQLNKVEDLCKKVIGENFRNISR